MYAIPFKRIAAVLAFFFLCAPLAGQNLDTKNSLGIDLRYSSASRLFPEPFSPDPFKRNYAEDLGDFLTFAGHYRRRLTKAVELQLTGEYLAHEKETFDNYGTKTSDGFRAYGAELLGLFRMPFSTGNVGFYAGGGGSFVYGERLYRIAGVEAESVESGLSFGIHVVFGIEYFIAEAFSLRGEFHFRDPQLEVRNRFPRSEVRANGITYRLPTEPFPSQVNLNGNIYSLGASWHF